MNEHTVPGETGGYLFQVKGSHPLRDTARWITRVGLASLGAAIMVVGTASNSSLSMPIGIATAVLGAVMLVLYLAARSNTKRLLSRARARKGHVGRRATSTAGDSLAADLALLANLYAQGALTAEEFAAAKRRLLDT